MRSFAVKVCLALLAITALFAQSDRGTITGTVADPAGAVVAGAAVEAKNVDTGVVFDTVTSATGNYTISNLPVGNYEVDVTVQGFKKYVRTGITVQVAQVLRVDGVLEVGAATESVTVNASAPLLDTETGDLRHNVDAAGMDTLPVLGIGSNQAGSAGIRNPYAMVEMIPGTMWQANAQIRVNGAPNNTQSFRIEGQEASNTGTPGVQAQTQPSVDAIQEVSIQTSNFAAEFGQVGGGYFNVTMKSGTNQYHGTGYENFVNEDLNAGNPFTDALAGTGNPRPRNRRNDYGFTIGGPAWIPKLYNGKDKTFFFFNWEQYREAVDINTQLETVPTVNYRNGNFATSEPNPNTSIGTDPLGRPIMAGEIYDPATQRTVNGQIVRDPFPSQTVPLARYDPVAVKIQNLFPLPMGPGAGGIVNNFQPNIPTTRVTQIPSIKIDQVVGAKSKFAFFWQETKTTAPLSFTFGDVDGLPDPLATNTATFQHAPAYRLNWDYTLSPTLLLHMGVGYRSNNFFTPSVNEEGALPTYNAQAQLGLNGGTTHTFFPVITGMCNDPGGFTPYICTGQGGMQNVGGEAQAHAFTESPTANTSLTKVAGNHTYKTGVEWRVEGYNAPSISNTEGSYTFAADQTSLPYLNGTTLAGQTPGFGYASFLLGAVKQISIANPVDPRLGKQEYGAFLQDSWKITRKLTFDYGVRYDYSTYLKDGLGREPDFSPTAVNPAVGGRLGAYIFDDSGPGHCDCAIAHNYALGFGPRLGVAYQINDKTVFRTGFGVIYGNTEANNNITGGLAGSSNTVSAPGGFGSTATTLAVGIPQSFNPLPWPNLNPGQFNTTPAPITAPNPEIDPNAGRPPRTYQWSAGFQRQLMKDMAVDVTYVGNRGMWWQSASLLNLNQIPYARLAAVGLSSSSPLLTDSLSNPAVVAAGLGGLPYAGFPTTQTLAQALRPFPQFTNINVAWAPLGDTWYEALQTKLTKRLSHGLTAVSTFTYQKNLTSGTEIGEPNPGTSGGSVSNDVFNRPNNKYISAYDQPFLFNVSLSYTTPKINTNKVVSYVLRDWTYGAFLQYASGFPIQVPFANNNLNSTLFAGSTAITSSTGTFADRVPGVPLFLQNLNCHCFDPQANFVLNPAAWVNPPAGQFGTSAAYYSNYRQQRRPVENMNFGRTWRIRERMTLNIRAEFTNVFNRSYIGNPTNTNAQAIQTRITSGATAGNTASGFGYINAQTPGVTNGYPRNGNLIARFSF
jgi:hypothetical protein